MTHCQLLDDYLDRDLPEENRQAFEAHLRECAACRQAVAEAGRVYAALADDAPLLQPATWEQIAARVRQQIEASPMVARREVTNARSRATLAWIAAAAVLLLGVALSWQLVSDDDQVVDDRAAHDQPADDRDTPDGTNRPSEPQTPLPHAPETRIAQTDTANPTSDAANANNTASVAENVLPSLVRQVGNTGYDQVPVKSKNPQVTIVWLMEQQPADETPAP